MPESALSIISGPPVPRPGEERFFPAAQVSVARAWALAGGIAVIEGRDRLGPAYHVCGRHALLLVWATRHGRDCSRLRPASRTLPARFDVSGQLAQELKGRARSDDADLHPPQPCLEGPASAGPSGRRRNVEPAR